MLGCFKKTESEADKMDKEINKKLKKEKKSVKMTHKIPVVGAGESGKSTLLKQMQILYINGFSEAEKRSKIKDIRNNIKDGILVITGAMKRLVPPVELENPENQKYIDEIHSTATKAGFDFPPSFFHGCNILWQDKGVQSCFARSHEYQLIDSAKYFLDKVMLIAKEEYLPDEQDILRCRVLTSGIFETKFELDKNICFHMYDVGGQRDERRKWLQVFCDVTAVIFVSACSAYDMTLREDANQNRLKESISLFKDIWNHRFLNQTSVILFLNKHDLFVEKIQSGKTKLEKYFPEFANYQLKVTRESVIGLENNIINRGSNSTTTPIILRSNSNSNNNNNNHHHNHNIYEASECPEVTRAKKFIEEEFIKISKASNSTNRSCYAHFTCAVDTENIKRVFEDCQDMLRRVFMQKIGFI